MSKRVKDDPEEDFVAPDDKAEEDKPAVTKKAKSEPADGSSSSSSASVGNMPKTAPGEKIFKLSDKRFLTVKKWKKMIQIDLREYYEKEKELLPGSKGLSLTPEQWAIVKSNIAEIDNAVAALK